MQDVGLAHLRGVQAERPHRLEQDGGACDDRRGPIGMEPDDVALVFYDYASWFLQGLRATGRDLSTERLVKTLQASSFKGQASYDTQRFRDNHIDPEWCRVEQVVNGQWTPRSEIIDPAKSSL